MSTTSGSSGLKRREFLKVLGATGAAAGTVGCSSDSVERLIPYLNHPDQTVPGVSNYYATTCRECAAGCGVIAEVRDGRAIKLEGNPAHPLNQGAICSKGQAALQGLYNPDRFRGPMMREGERLVPITWDRALQELNTRLDQAGPALANGVFINQHESGSFPVVLDQWLATRGIPGHLSYDADLNLGTIAAHRQAYGVAWPTIDFTQARLIVSVGADFLDDWGAAVPQQLNFADARAQLQNAPRFVYVGPRRSLTGLNADQWIPCRPGSELAIMQALGGTGTASIAQAAEAAGVEPTLLQGLADELRGAGRSMILAGTRGADAMEVALAAAALNQALGNVGVTILPGSPATAFERAASYADVRGVVEQMASGQVPVFFVRGANPAFTTPPALGFAAAMARVPFKVSFSSYPDETTLLCDLILPDHHALESWGDAQPVPGLIGLQQPTMDPVFNTRPTADLLLLLTGGGALSAAPLAISGATSPGVEVPGAAALGSQVVPAPAPGAVTTTPREHLYRDWLIGRIPGGAAALTSALQTGLIAGNVGQSAAAVRPAPAPVAALPAIAQTEGDFFFHIYPSPLLGTGSGANKPWLQELADPVSKIAWQTWIEIHPTRAWDMGIDNGDLVTITTGTGSVTAPAYLYLGIHPDTVAMPLGRGHTAYGRYAAGIGVNPLIAVPAAEDAQSGGLAYSVTKCRVTKTGGFDDLVTTEGSARQHGRGIAQAMTVAELMAPVTDDHGHDIPGVPSYEPLPGLRSPVAADAQGELADPDSKDKGMYDPQHWSKMASRRWAMTIDLARCTGCSACVTACYAENNIPTVGAPWQGRATSPLTWDERPGANIVKGREMTWIRIERYFEGGEDYGSNFDTRFAPMLCQHCGNAPCEPVCPVYATYHSPDGLNVQVYNRCVGTRYCSNNCPYKVRYFNWFGYGEPNRRQYAFPEPLNWQLNPDVTVRGKGVMEKCTFCVQRIREAEHRAVAEGRLVEADEFTTACAQACPSRAIVFGDAADATWSVAQLATDRRAYHVFGDLSTYTAVVYLKSIIHPGPATPVQA